MPSLACHQNLNVCSSVLDRGLGHRRLPTRARTWHRIENIRHGARRRTPIKTCWKKRKIGTSIPSIMSPQLTLHPSQISLRNLYELLKPITVSPSSPRARFYNFAETFNCAPVTVFEPETEYQCELILDLARRECKKVRVVGAGFSPSDLACTNEFMLRTDKLNRILQVRHIHMRQMEILICTFSDQFRKKIRHCTRGCHPGQASRGVGKVWPRNDMHRFRVGSNPCRSNSDCIAWLWNQLRRYTDAGHGGDPDVGRRLSHVLFKNRAP